jgi:hypothetical protein
MFIAANDQMLLPLVVIDTKTVEARRPTRRSSKTTVSGARRARASVEANIVRLMPGATHLPFGLSAR